MEERLHSIESLLAETNNMLHALMNKQQLQAPTNLTLSPSVGMPTDLVNDDNSDQNTSFAGIASLLAHSRKARHDVEHLLQSSPSLRNDPEIKAALDVLRSATRRSYTAESSLLHADRDTEPSNFESGSLPSYNLILRVVQEAQASDSLFFLIWSPFFTPSELLHLCGQLYQNFGICSMAIKTILCGALYYMFIEYLSARKFPPDSIHWLQGKRFLKFFEHYLRSWNVLSLPSTENILALVFGAGHAIQKGDHASAWPMVSMACTMCVN